MQVSQNSNIPAKGTKYLYKIPPWMKKTHDEAAQKPNNKVVEQINAKKDGNTEPVVAIDKTEESNVVGVSMVKQKNEELKVCNSVKNGEQINKLFRNERQESESTFSVKSGTVLDEKKINEEPEKFKKSIATENEKIVTLNSSDQIETDKTKEKQGKDSELPTNKVKLNINKSNITTMYGIINRNQKQNQDFVNKIDDILKKCDKSGKSHPTKESPLNIQLVKNQIMLKKTHNKIFTRKTDEIHPIVNKSVDRVNLIGKKQHSKNEKNDVTDTKVEKNLKSDLPPENNEKISNNKVVINRLFDLAKSPSLAKEQIVEVPKQSATKNEVKVIRTNELSLDNKKGKLKSEKTIENKVLKSNIPSLCLKPGSNELMFKQRSLKMKDKKCDTQKMKPSKKRLNDNKSIFRNLSDNDKKLYTLIDEIYRVRTRRKYHNKLVYLEKSLKKKEHKKFKKRDMKIKFQTDLPKMTKKPTMRQIKMPVDLSQSNPQSKKPSKQSTTSLPQTDKKNSRVWISNIPKRNENYENWFKSPLPNKNKVYKKLQPSMNKPAFVSENLLDLFPENRNKLSLAPFDNKIFTRKKRRPAFGIPLVNNLTGVNGGKYKKMKLHYLKDLEKLLKKSKEDENRLVEKNSADCHDFHKDDHMIDLYVKNRKKCDRIHKKYKNGRPNRDVMLIQKNVSYFDEILNKTLRPIIKKFTYFKETISEKMIELVEQFYKRELQKTQLNTAKYLIKDSDNKEMISNLKLEDPKSRKEVQEFRADKSLVFTRKKRQPIYVNDNCQQREKQPTIHERISDNLVNLYRSLCNRKSQMKNEMQTNTNKQEENPLPSEKEKTPIKKSKSCEELRIENYNSLLENIVESRRKIKENPRKSYSEILQTLYLNYSKNVCRN